MFVRGRASQVPLQRTTAIFGAAATTATPLISATFFPHNGSHLLHHIRSSDRAKQPLERLGLEAGIRKPTTSGKTASATVGTR